MNKIKILLVSSILACSLFASDLYAQSKISDLTAIGTLAGEDLTVVVDDPSGSPLSRKATMTQISTIVGSELNVSGTNTGDQTITLTGDTTGTGTGSFTTTIAAGAVDVSMLANGTDGELVTWDAAGAATTVTTGTAGQLLTSNGAGVEPTFQSTLLAANKSSDTTRTSTTTVTDDPHLTAAVEINSVYEFEAMLFINSPAAADFKFGWSYPAATTMKWYLTDQSTVSYKIETGLIAIPTSGSPNTEAPIIKGVLITSSTAGNFALQWAQNTGDVGNTILEQYSFIKLTKIQ